MQILQDRNLGINELLYLYNVYVKEGVEESDGATLEESYSTDGSEQKFYQKLGMH